MTVAVADIVLQLLMLMLAVTTAAVGWFLRRALFEVEALRGELARARMEVAKSYVTRTEHRSAAMDMRGQLKELMDALSERLARIEKEVVKCFV